jgi:hypothetical protein
MKTFRVFEFTNGELNNEFTIKNDDISQVMDYVKDEILQLYQDDFDSNDIHIDESTRMSSGHSHTFIFCASAYDFDKAKSASSVHHYTVVEL